MHVSAGRPEAVDRVVLEIEFDQDDRFAAQQPVVKVWRRTERGEAPAPPARRDDREYREYLSEEQRGRRGCIARRMQPDSHHGLLA